MTEGKAKAGLFIHIRVIRESGNKGVTRHSRINSRQQDKRTKVKLVTRLRRQITAKLKQEVRSYN